MEAFYSRPFHIRERSFGFTLLEVLVALIILVILINMAVPSFLRFRLSSSLQSQADLVFRLTQASRAAALDTASNITICGTADFRQCQREDSQHLMAFTDRNDSGLREADEAIVYQYSLPSSLRVHLRTPRNTARDWLKYRYAQADANPYGSFYICDRNQALGLGQGVAVSSNGRNRLWQPRPFVTEECSAQRPR